MTIITIIITKKDKRSGSTSCNLHYKPTNQPFIAIHIALNFMKHAESLTKRKTCSKDKIFRYAHSNKTMLLGFHRWNYKYSWFEMGRKYVWYSKRAKDKKRNSLNDFSCKSCESRPNEISFDSNNM